MAFSSSGAVGGVGVRVERKRCGGGGLGGFSGDGGSSNGTYSVEANRPLAGSTTVRSGVDAGSGMKVFESRRN